MAKYLGRLGYAGVTFFFVLSGFVLMWSARDHDTVLGFYRRRLVKIFPNHLVTWVAGFVLMAVTGALAAVPLAALVPSLFLVQSWSTELPVLFGTNGPSWSLACELLFYLSFPLLAPVVRAVRRDRLWVAAAVATAAIVAVPVVAVTLPGTMPSPFQDMPWIQNWFAYFLPVSRVGDFALGMVLARIVGERAFPRIPVGAALALVGLGYAGMILLPGPIGLVAPVAPPLALLVAALADREYRGAPGRLAARPLVVLGEISFAFYMVHFLVLQYGPVGLATRAPDDIPRPPLEALALVLVSLLISLALGWLLYRFVEVPAMNRWGRTGRRAPAPEPGPRPVMESMEQEAHRG
jgi:peptidoglycan/LPS O-acetylase OafA/YrhL